MVKKSRWVVTTSGSRPIGKVRDDLEKAGFSIDQVLEEIGVLLGSADEVAAAAAQELDGVADISAEGEIDIGPPDSPVTW